MKDIHHATPEEIELLMKAAPECFTITRAHDYFDQTLTALMLVSDPHVSLSPRTFGHSAAFSAWKPKLDLREQTPGARANRRNRHKQKAGA